MIWVGAATSGAHYNWAVTIGLMATRNCGLIQGCTYLVSQMIGSILAGVLLRLVVPHTIISKNNTNNQPELGFPATSTSKFDAFVFEVIGTFVLVFMVMTLVVDSRAPKHVYAIAIGGAVGVSIFAFGNFSGAALNPMRWFGPALISYLWPRSEQPGFYLNEWWVYIFAPIIGGCLASTLWQFVLRKDEYSEVKSAKIDFD